MTDNTFAPAQLNDKAGAVTTVTVDNTGQARNAPMHRA